VTGGVPPVTITCTSDSGDFFSIGPPTTVTCTATDSAPPQPLSILDTPAISEALNVSATFTVTVIDTEPPVIEDLPDLVRTTPGDPVSVMFPLPSASDNSGIPPIVTCDTAPGSMFSIGVATVTCVATDDAGNIASSSFTVTVTVQGSTPPPPPTNQLPQTGGAPTTIILIAAGLLMVGLLLRRSRHHVG